jgi:flagellar secretion chaperone FliS
MPSSAVERYKEVRLQTSTPGELLLALYDGLFRFLKGAKLCLENKQPARARELLGKAYAIVAELYLALDHTAAAELCRNLASVYDFCMTRLNDAMRTASIEQVEEVIRVLTPLREAWELAVPAAIKEAARGK